MGNLKQIATGMAGVAADSTLLAMAFNALDRANIRYERKSFNHILVWLPKGRTLPEHKDLTEAGAYVIDQHYDIESESRVYVYHHD